MQRFTQAAARPAILTALLAACCATAPVASQEHHIDTGFASSTTPLTLAAGLRSFGMGSSFEKQFDQTFLESYWKSYPERAVMAGYLEFADRMTVPDARTRAKIIGQLNKWLSQLHRFDPAVLDEPHRSDWFLLDNTFEAHRWALTEYRAYEWNPALYNVGEPFAIVLRAEHAPREERLRLLLARLAEVSTYYAAAKHNLIRPTREHTRLAIEENRHALQIIDEELPKHVAESKLRKSERALFARRIAAACAAIEDYIGWLEGLDFQLAQREAPSFRLGRELYERKFTFTVQSGGTADSLYRRALQEKELLHTRMEQLTEAMWRKYFGARPIPVDRLEKISRMVARLEELQVLAPRNALRSAPSLESDASILATPLHTTEQPESLVRAYFSNDVTAEGWSLYHELAELEASGSTPEAWLMHSLTLLGTVCNTLLDYGVHALDMTEEQALELLVREGFLSVPAARKRWEQVQVSSVRLAEGFAGFSEIYDLREQLKQEFGARFNLTLFNQQFQSYGCAPVKVIKDLMRPALLAQLHAAPHIAN